MNKDLSFFAINQHNTEICIFMIGKRKITNMVFVKLFYKTIYILTIKVSRVLKFDNAMHSDSCSLF